MKRFKTTLIIFVFIISYHLNIGAAFAAPTLSPSSLSEHVLDGSAILLKAAGLEFTTDVSSHIQLNNAPPGTTLFSVDRIDSANLYLTLNHDGTDFDSNYANFSVTVLSGGIVGGGSNVTSNDITIMALQEGGGILPSPDDITVSGASTIFYDGEAFPEKIVVTGYDLRANTMYLNIDLTTTAPVAPGQVVAFSYYVEVWDGSASLIGRIKDPDGTPYDNSRPKSITGPAGLSSVAVGNLAVKVNDSGNSSLPASYRLVVTVKEIQVI